MNQYNSIGVETRSTVCFFHISYYLLLANHMHCSEIVSRDQFLAIKHWAVEKPFSNFLVEKKCYHNIRNEFQFYRHSFFHQSVNYTVMILKLSLFWILESEQNKCALMQAVILSTSILFFSAFLCFCNNQNNQSLYTYARPNSKFS